MINDDEEEEVKPSLPRTGARPFQSKQGAKASKRRMARQKGRRNSAKTAGISTRHSRRAPAAPLLPSATRERERESKIPEINIAAPERRRVYKGSI